MATLIRVKRRISEEPADALIVQCKRMKPLDDEAAVPILERIENRFRFAGTVTCKKAPLSRFLLTTASDGTKHRNPKLRITDTSGKRRSEMKQNTNMQRFKLVNAYRGLDPTTLDEIAEKEARSDTKAEEAEVQRLVSLLDVVEEADDIKEVKKVSKENTITCNGVPMIRNKVTPDDAKAAAQGYVYDVYLTENLNWDDTILQHSVTIEKACLDSDITVGSDEDEPAEDDEDSNDENYYTNDYPEEDSDFEGRDFWGEYEDEPDVVKGLSEFHLDDDNDDDDKLVYSKPSDEDVKTYGLHCARFRAQLLNGLGE